MNKKSGCHSAVLLLKRNCLKQQERRLILGAQEPALVSGCAGSLQLVLMNNESETVAMQMSPNKLQTK